MLLFVVCAVMCVGCSVNFSGSIDEDGNSNLGNGGSNNNQITVPTITMDEAEKIIKNALACDDSKNESILKKFGKHSLYFENSTIDVYSKNVTGTKTVNSVYEYSSESMGLINGYSKTHMNRNGVLSASESYLLNDVNYQKNDKGSFKEDENSILERQLEYFLIDRVFSEGFYEEVYDYDNRVEKVATTDGYKLSIKNGLSGVMYFNGRYMQGDKFNNVADYKAALEKRYSQELIDECFVCTTINFDYQGNVIGVKFEFTILNQGEGDHVQMKFLIEVKPTDEVITQPQWLTDNLASK